MQRHSSFIPLVTVFKFVANRNRSQKVANAFLAYLRAFSSLRLDFLRSRTQAELVASFERFLFLLRLLDLDNVDINEGRVIDQKLANAIVADLTRLSCC